MTPQLIHESNGASCVASESRHLTDVEFCELLDCRVSVAGEDRAIWCDECTVELDAMRDALAMFRQATKSYADDELRRLSPMSIPTRRTISSTLMPSGWLAAAAMLLAVLIPMHTSQRRLSQPAATPALAASMDAGESDEALLEDVDRDVSATVPAPMRALANTADSDSSSALGASAANSEQRRD